MTVRDFLVRSASEALCLQRKDGSMPPGCNGPYRDRDTPVRNTAHWTVTFCQAFRLTGDSTYREAARSAAAYLTSRAARPAGAAFLHRNTYGRDQCNGLIGQAWTLEGLVEASRTLNDDQYSRLASEVFFMHVFSENNGLWHRLDPRGGDLGIDVTFNHQLWFAAAASLIDSDRTDEIHRRVRRFLDFLPRNLTVLKSGLIYHPIVRPFSLKGRCRDALSHILPRLGRWDETRLIPVSLGYHAFCTYAAGILRDRMPDHECWTLDSLRRAGEYLLHEDYSRRLLGESMYGFAYNPPGFEVPFSLGALRLLSGDRLLQQSEWWLNRQFERSYASETRTMTKGTADPVTLHARIYELARWPDALQGCAVPV